jgi:ligand-binding sensor domain-containing protein
MPARRSAAFIFLVLALFSTFPQFIGAQNLTFRQIGTSDGLSHGVVTCRLQDSKGFVWIGTQNGLNRYDGYSFVHYTSIPFDSTGLGGHSISALCEDSSGSGTVGAG